MSILTRSRPAPDPLEEHRASSSFLFRAFRAPGHTFLARQACGDPHARTFALDLPGGRVPPNTIPGPRAGHPTEDREGPARRLPESAEDLRKHAFVVDAVGYAPRPLADVRSQNRSFRDK
ncbi:hypothetical protein GCM10022252_73980 [Streptosporangium oxazolinicum]|uniref:Uncharacterized protein n=1 Tax=Streptosporangium oxazolinicum TaxID=909287 RepID=A0ABP8BJQ5_9ACTN